MKRSRLLAAVSALFLSTCVSAALAGSDIEIGTNGGTPAGAGGPAAAASYTVPAATTDGGVLVSSTGGKGGQGAVGVGATQAGTGGLGGVGGSATAIIDGTANGAVTATSAGGAGGTGGTASGDPGSESGDGGNGGAAGAVVVDVNGTAGLVTAESQGGNSGGPGARGGPDAGSGLRGHGGAAGSVTVTIDGTVTGVTASSIGGTGIGTFDGAPGAVDVTITGTVNGDVATFSGVTEDANVGGSIDVIINGVVTGTISANAAATSSLTFEFDVARRVDFDAAATALAQGAGSVSINGNVYSWTGFDTLYNYLRYTGTGDVVVVTIGAATGDVGGPNSNAGDAFGAPSASAPLLATGPVRCLPRTLTAQRQGDGSVRLIAKMLEGSGFFEFGLLRGTAFDASPGTPDWSVDVVTDKRNRHLRVIDEAGALVGICVLAGRPPKEFVALR